MDPVVNNNLIKQPKPSFDTSSGQNSTVAQNTKKQKRKINRPKVGVVDAPLIPTAPLSDSITLKKLDTPKPVIETPKKNNRNFSFQTKLSFIIGGCGIASLISLIRSFKK